MAESITIGQTVAVYPSSSEYEHLAGHEATIVRELGDEERDLAEVGRMFAVEFKEAA